MNDEAGGRGKVFCIGFPKTGTTSLEVALGRLGYTVCRGNSQNNHSNYLMALQLHGDTEAIARLIRQFDAFADMPWGGTDMYLWLSRRYPDACFVHTVREKEAWYRSLLNQMRKMGSHGREPLDAFDAAGGYGASLTVRRTWRVADPVAEKDRVLEYYTRLNTEIRSHFAGRDNFLSLDLTRDPEWSALCSFLGRAVPDEPFPHQNRGDGNRQGRAPSKSL